MITCRMGTYGHIALFACLTYSLTYFVNKGLDLENETGLWLAVHQHKTTSQRTTPSPLTLKAVTRGPPEVAESEILGDLWRSRNLKC